MRMLLVGVAVAAVALLMAQSAAADGGWERVYSRPGADVSAITMFDDAHGLAIAGAGVLRTEDGGETWASPAADPPMPPGHIIYADADDAWAGTWSGGIWRTEDGGATWTKQTSGTIADVNAIAVIDADEASAAALGVPSFSDVPTIPAVHPPSVLLHTTDAGGTWQPVQVAGFGQFYDVAFAGEHGWLTASRCRPGELDAAPSAEGCDDTHVLLTSDDAGRTWTPLAPQPLVHPDRLHFFDASHGDGTFATCAADGCRTQLFATSDGGLTWALRDAGAGQVQDFVFRTPLDGWLSIGICGGNGCQTRLAHTKDGGATFADVDVPPPSVTSPPAAGLAVTSGAVFVSGGSTGIERYDIARGTWSEATTDARLGLGTVVFATHDRGYALSATTSVLARSDDGGSTWRHLDTPATVYAIAATPDALWALACDAARSDCSKLFRSADGEHWTPVNLPAAVDAASGPGIQAYGDRAWISTQQGFWRSDDGGASWQALTQAGGPTAYTFIDRNNGFASICPAPGCTPAVAITGDGGETSVLRPLPPGASVAYFFSADVGFATARDAAEPNSNCPCAFHVYRTDDGARTWTDLEQSSEDSFDSLVFADGQHGFAVRHHLDRAPGEIVATSDGGRTWQPDLAVPPGAFTAASGRIWLTTQLGFSPFGENGRTDVYRRDIGPAPNITAPDTGAPAAGSDSRSFGGREFALLAGGVLLALLLAAVGWVLRRRHGSLP